MWKDWEKDQLLNYCWLKMRSIRKRLNQKYKKKKKTQETSVLQVEDTQKIV